MERNATGSNENNGTKKWVHCDFCRTKKKPKFNSKHIEVSNTDVGQFQGPTCYLSLHNTEIVPLSEEKVAALEAEKVAALEAEKPKAKRKTKRIAGSGLNPEEKEKKLDDEYKELLKIAAAEDKDNRKIALERRKLD